MPEAHGQPSMKATAVPPQITTGENVELSNVQMDRDKLPLLEDVMQLARLGEIEPMHRIFKDGKASAEYKDDEGITPLHVGIVLSSILSTSTMADC